jgi:hypothetical protein
VPHARLFLLRTISCFAGALILIAAPSADAGEITVFASSDMPRAQWNYGQGGALSLGLFRVISLEVEGARSLAKDGDTRMTYFTFGAGLKLPVTSITPFAGMGVGIYYQSQPGVWKLHTFDSYFAGAKTRIKDLVIVRAEYRHYVLRGTPYRPFEGRLSLGAGIAF